jgi:hypothetical protein
MLLFDLGIKYLIVVFIGYTVAVTATLELLAQLFKIFGVISGGGVDVWG